MELPDVQARLEHPAFATTIAMFVGYALVLLLIVGVLFLLPWLILSAL